MEFLARTYSVLLASASEKFNTALLPLLPSTDYWPIHRAASGAEARRRLLETAYDIVLINAPLPDESGTRLAVSVCADSGAGVLLVVRSEQYESVYDETVSHGVMILPKPTSQQLLTQSLRMLRSTRERLRRMEEKQLTVEEKIREIRLMNRAKWLLIEYLNMTEENAHRYLEKQAMDMRISKAEMAERVIQTYGK